MGKLSDWAKQNSRFFKILDGETVKVVFEGYKFTKSSFNPERDTITLTIKTSEGQKIWNTSSGKVAEFFDNVKPGQTVSIHRIGEGSNTKYDLSVVEETGSDDDSPEEPEPTDES